MTLWHLAFPLVRHRPVAPAFREYDTGEARERAGASACTDLAVLVLFDADPDGFTDRAMKGWCPGDRALDALRAQLGQWAKTAAAGEVA